MNDATLQMPSSCYRVQNVPGFDVPNTFRQNCYSRAPQSHPQDNFPTIHGDAQYRVETYR